MAKYINNQGLKVLNALDQTAQKHNTTMAAVALAWLPTREQVHAPIASASDKTQLLQILQSVSLKLDKKIWNC